MAQENITPEEFVDQRSRSMLEKLLPEYVSIEVTRQMRSQLDIIDEFNKHMDRLTRMYLYRIYIWQSLSFVFTMVGVGGFMWYIHQKKPDWARQLQK